MPCIDKKVEVLDTVFKQVFSTSVPPTLSITEYEVAEAILKADGQKKDDAYPPVSLWVSFDYIFYFSIIYKSLVYGPGPMKEF